MEIDGRYRIEAKLGQGGAAQVFRALDLKLSRAVALKFLETKGPIASEVRFREEARVLSGIRHPSIVSVLDFGVYRSRPYLVLELVEGGTLLSRIQQGALSIPEAARIGTELLDALEATHEAQILHRDLKPENILLTSEGSAKLSDFGLAKVASSGIQTASGLILGTPEYMAPEVMYGEVATEASDLYSWGCVLYAAVRGQKPFQGDLRALMQSKESLRVDFQGFDPRLRALFEQVLDPKPKQRPGLGEIRRALEGLGDGRTTAPGPPPSASLDQDSTQAISGLSPVSDTRVLSSRTRVSAASPPMGSSPSEASLGQRAPRILASILGLGLLLGLGWKFLSPPSPSPAEAEAERARMARQRKARDLLETWGRQTSQVDPEAWILKTQNQVEELQKEELSKRNLLQGIGVVGANSIPAMAKRRAGESESGFVGAEVLRRQRGEDRLPLPSKPFRKDLNQLRDALMDPGIEWSAKEPLWDLLGKLSAVDEYFLAWGDPAPYRVSTLTDAVVPRQIRRVESAQAPQANLRRSAGVGPTLYRLFLWENEEIQKLPYLFPHGREPIFSAVSRGTSPEAIEKMFPEIKIENHQRIQVEVEVPQVVLNRKANLELVFVTGVFLVPQVLRFQVGDQVYRCPAPIHETTTDTVGMPRPTLEFRVRVPITWWSRETTPVQIELHSLPGLRRYGNLGFYWLGARVQPLEVPAALKSS